MQWIVNTRYLKNEKHLQEKQEKEIKRRNALVQKPLKIGRKELNSFDEKTGILKVNSRFRSLKNVPFQKNASKIESKTLFMDKRKKFLLFSFCFDSMKRSGFLFLKPSRDIFDLQKRLNSIFVNWNVTYNSLKILQKYKFFRSFIELFSFDFFKSLENTIREEKNFFVDPFLNFGDFQNITCFNESFIELDKSFYVFFQQHRFKVLMNFTSREFFDIKNPQNRKVQDDDVGDAKNKKNHLLKTLYYGVKYFKDYEFNELEMLNFVDFLNYESTQKIYKQKNRSIRKNYNKFEKAFFSDFNVHKSQLFNIYLAILVRARNPIYPLNFSALIHKSSLNSNSNPSFLEKARKKKFQNLLFKKYYYEYFYRFAKKIACLSNNAFTVSQFKKDLLPFLAIEKRVRLVLNRNEGFFVQGFKPINYKPSDFDPTQKTWGHLTVSDKYLLNFNRQKTTRTSLNFLTAKNKTERAFSMVHKTKNFKRSESPNFPFFWSKTKILTKENLQNPQVLRFCVDSLIRLRFLFTFVTSKKAARCEKTRFYSQICKRAFNILESTQNLEKEISQNFVFLNGFFNTKTIEKSIFYKKQSGRLLGFRFRTQKSLFIESRTYPFLFKNALFSGFLKSSRIEKSVYFLLEKTLNDRLKTNDLELQDFELCSDKTKTSRSLFFNEKLQSLFKTYSNTNSTTFLEKKRRIFSEMGFQLFYKIYAIKDLKKSRFVYILERKALLNHIKVLRRLIKSSANKSQQSLIQKLNPKVYTWCYVYRFLWSVKMTPYIDRRLFNFLWYWACRKHNNKSKKWVRTKYFYDFHESGFLFGCRVKKNSIYHLQHLYLKGPGNFLRAESKISKFLFMYLPSHVRIFQNVKKSIFNTDV